MDDEVKQVVQEKEDAPANVPFLSKREIVFFVWNTTEKRDDRFDIQVSVLPRMTEEQIVVAARMKALSFINSRSCYAGQKLRLKGESV